MQRSLPKFLKRLHNPSENVLHGSAASIAQYAGEPFVRRMVIGYATGLCLIAGFTLVANYLADQSLARQQESAHIVNISGRQRILSQRIVSLCLQLKTDADKPHAHSFPAQYSPTTETRRDLDKAIQLMRSSSVALIYGSIPLHLPPTQDRIILSIYNAPPYNLKIRLNMFLSQAKQLSSLPDDAIQADHSNLQQLEIAAHGPLLDALQASVDRDQLLSEQLVRSLHNLFVYLTWLMMGILAVEACLIYRPTLRALAHSQKALRLAAITDALTGCLNRRWFMEQANIEFTRATQFKTSLTMILIDIDHFKQVNDNYGHPAGDMVLVELVAAILRLVRETDRLARIGGEEFAILLPNTDQETGLQLAQRLLLAISTQRLNVANTTMQITVSIGVATFDPLDVTFDSLLNRTDAHLYEAKHTGRNRVCHKVLAANAALLPSLYGQSA